MDITRLDTPFVRQVREHLEWLQIRRERLEDKVQILEERVKVLEHFHRQLLRINDELLRKECFYQRQISSLQSRVTFLNRGRLCNNEEAQSSYLLHHERVSQKQRIHRCQSAPARQVTVQ